MHFTTVNKVFTFIFVDSQKYSKPIARKSSALVMICDGWFLFALKKDNRSSISDFFVINSQTSAVKLLIFPSSFFLLTILKRFGFLLRKGIAILKICLWGSQPPFWLKCDLLCQWQKPFFLGPSESYKCMYSERILIGKVFAKDN